MADDSTQRNSGAPESPVHDAATEARIIEIVDLMMRCRFRRGRTVKELAQRWELTEQRVRLLTAEASRRVRAQLGDPDEVAADLLPELHKTFRVVNQRARADGNPKMATAAASIGNLIAEISGAKAPKRKELSGPGGGPVEVATTAYDPKNLTDEQLERVIRGEPPGPGDPRRSRSGA